MAAVRWLVFFFNDTATTEIYTLSLHDALPICRELHRASLHRVLLKLVHEGVVEVKDAGSGRRATRSEEHTSELQSRQYLVCRLLLEKKKQRRRALVPHPHCARTSRRPRSVFQL